MKRKSKDDFLVFVKLCLENLEEKPGSFLKKAIKIDLLRNTFSKGILYNYFLYLKRYLKDGYKVKAMPQNLCDVVDSLRKKKCQVAISEPKKISYEEIVKHIDNELNLLGEKVNKAFDEIDKQVEMLAHKKIDLTEYLNKKRIEINEKREALINEYFERM